MNFLCSLFKASPLKGEGSMVYSFLKIKFTGVSGSGKSSEVPLLRNPTLPINLYLL